MNNHQITRTLAKSAFLLKMDLGSDVLESLDNLYREYENEELNEFIRDLIEAGNESSMIMLEKHLKKEKFKEFVNAFQATPIIVFSKLDELSPVIIEPKKKKFDLYTIKEGETVKETRDSIDHLNLACTDTLEVIFISVFDYKSLVSDTDSEDRSDPVSPLKRLYKLLAAEKRDIFYVYVYAALIGILSLTLPLGIQAAIELISGGVFFSSVYILITVIIIGVLASGVLQVFQITIVEYLQQRVFTKAAFEFAFRVPRIKMEAVFDLHIPELMNRFFDVLTLQKGLPKLLIDLSTGIIQILFGLILLSFYHPFFVFFGVLLLLILFGIFYITGPKGLKSSIVESKYKYRVVYWLEEMARTLYSFKLSGNTSLPIKKTDYNVNNYLKNRGVHFRVLISQYSYVLLFKVIVTGGLLILGTVLVVQREITLGQFVASEVIIILIINSVEKIIMYMDTVYDMLTAVDKISHVTDLPIESTGGIDIPATQLKNHGISIKLTDIKYQYANKSDHALKNINLKIKSGERLCISGGGASGKTTLSNLIAGIHTNYDGVITFNNYSLRDLDKTYLRDKIGKNVSQDDIFEGTILDNILVGKPFAKIENAITAIDNVGLTDYINHLPQGINTNVLSGGKGFPTSIINRIILARCIAKEPKILILNDFFTNFTKAEKLDLIQFLTKPENTWTFIVISNDPLIMSCCDRVLYLEQGEIVADGSFEEIIKNETITKNIF